ncbi:Prophage integrase IntA [wastewater metagenome]|uniref:Prophage integrase IntA n=2 Tax=unclassified sequences TaxID=12908 RepID=A0A5B8RDZ8_9ZZZZ|nr:integrase arm-type DNA-binding domain-containing protein [Arhodomonas sp. KWT]QEA06128.1 prophage integrase IntA [uncultured organism]
MALTDREARQAKPAERQYTMADGKGLSLLVTPKGGKWWRFRYRYGGKQRMLSLGTYPETSLKQARDKRDEARGLLDDGVDPSAHRKATRAAQAEATANTFEALAREWYESKHSAEVVAEHAERNLRRLEQYAFPTLARTPVREINPPEVLDALRRIVDQGKVETAHRVKALIGQVMRYAIATGRAERDPTPDLRDALPPSRPTHHAALVKPDEVAPLLRTIDDYGGQPATRAALRLAPMLIVRPGELRKAEWADFDMERGEWATTAKGGVPLVVPLPRQALDVLRELEPITGRGSYVFPSVRGKGRPMSNNTINAALKRMGYGDEMTGHGFRAMARTILVERLGFPVEIVEMQLGHRVRDVHGRAYNRTQWLEDRRSMMQTWADYLDSLKAGDANVVPLKGRR